MPAPKLNEDQQEAFDALQDFYAAALKRGWNKAGKQGVNKSYAFGGVEHSDHDVLLYAYFGIYQPKQDSAPDDKFIFGSKTVTQDEALEIIKDVTDFGPEGAAHTVPPTDAAHSAAHTVPPTDAAHSAAHGEEAVPPTDVPPTEEKSAAHQHVWVDEWCACGTNEFFTDASMEVPPTSKKQDAAHHVEPDAAHMDAPVHGGWIAGDEEDAAHYLRSEIHKEIAQLIEFLDTGVDLPPKITVGGYDFEMTWNNDGAAVKAVPVFYGENRAQIDWTDDEKETAALISGWLIEGLAIEDEEIEPKVAAAAKTLEKESDEQSSDAFCQNDLSAAAEDMIVDPNRLWSVVASELSNEELVRQCSGSVVTWLNYKSKKQESASVTPVSRSKNHPAHVTGKIRGDDDMRVLNFIEEGGGFRSLAVCRIVSIK